MPLPSSALPLAHSLLWAELLKPRLDLFAEPLPEPGAEPDAEEDAELEEKAA